MKKFFILIIFISCNVLNGIERKTKPRENKNLAELLRRRQESGLRLNTKYLAQIVSAEKAARQKAARASFELLIRNNGTLKNQQSIRALIQSGDLDVNAVMDFPVLGGDGNATIKKTWMHVAIEKLDLSLMQLLTEFDFNLTLESSGGLTPLAAYQRYASSMKKLRCPVDRVKHREILKILTPKQV